MKDIKKETRIWMLKQGERVHIFSSTSKDSTRIFRDHSTNMGSEALYEAGKPEMFLLEEAVLTEIQAYGHRIAWYRRVQDEGLAICDSPNVVDAVENMHKKDIEVYNKIKDVSLADLIAPDLDKAQYIQLQASTQKKLSFFVSAEEYEQLRKDAIDHEMSVSDVAKSRFEARELRTVNVISLHAYIQRAEKVVAQTTAVAQRLLVRNEEAEELMSAIKCLRRDIESLSERIDTLLEERL